jgi:hypothetical protein
MADPAQREHASRVGHSWTLAGIVLSFAVFNTVIMRLFADHAPWEELEAIIIGAWVFEPLLFAAWAAFGPGRFAMRATLIIPCLALVVAAPGLDPVNLESVQRFEYVVLLIVAFAILAIATLIFLILRRYVGWQIVSIRSEPRNSDRPFQYDTKYLISLVTLCSLALGITFSLKFSPAEPPSSFFGPGFYIYVMAVGGAVISLLLLPIVAIPLWVITERPSKKFYRGSAELWLVLTFSIGGFWLIAGEGMEPKAILYPLLIQFGATVVGIAAALPLRWTGCRLVSHTLSLVRESTSEPQ